jgi:uncharacterized membrane protein (DUF373 family)
MRRQGRQDVPSPDKNRQITLANLFSYERFENYALRVILLLLCLIATYMIAVLAIQLFDDFKTGPGFAEKSALQETFGLILSILILLEFSHSIAVSISKRTGPISVGIVVLITILVVARKLIFLDYASTSAMTLLGYCGTLLTLGILYWLIRDGGKEKQLLQHDP